MNLSKEQLQRGILGLIMVGLAFYVYSSMLLSPLAKRESKAEADMADLEPKVRQATLQINRTRAIEAGDPNREGAGAVRKVLEEKLPQEAAIVWLPQETVDVFRRNGVEGARVSPRGSQPDEELVGYVRSNCAVTIPLVGYHEFAQAVAALENHFGLAQIQNVTISALPADVEKQSATLLFSTVTRP